MQINIKKFKQFLEQNVFFNDVKSLKHINRGGTSCNFVLTSTDTKYLLKAINKQQFSRVIKLCNILQALEKEHNIYSPHLIKFQNKPYFEYDQWLILIIEFIDGKKLSAKQIDNQLIDKIFSSYQNIKNLNFDTSEKRCIKNIYAENKDMLDKFLFENKNFIKRKILQSVYTLNEKLNNKTMPEKALQIIHGDASLNNCLKDANNQIALLDFELIRLGYPVEDWAEFLISSLFQHQIYFFSTKKLKNLILHCNKLFLFEKSDWQYGIDLYFLNLINKRLKSKKLFKSIRKAWLFSLNNKKYQVITDLINSIY
ncbi:MAG: hypothetical protein E7016_02770 [Alphaproteobacteria bacterium]|nr:hypothetical protein [Alphaproteobacteria bacterium]